MDLVLLAAGFATRLEPLTLNQPKHLLPVRGGVFVDLLMNQLEKVDHKFSHKVIITNDKYFDKFSVFADKIDRGYEVINDGVKSKIKRIGAIGDLFSAVDQANLEGDLLILAMDYIFIKFDFDHLLKFINKKNASVTIARRESNINILKAGSCLDFTKDGKVTRFQEKPKTPFSSFFGVPYYFVKKGDLALVRNLPKNLWDNCGQIAKIISDKSSLYAYRCDEEYLHMTTLDDYKLMQ